MNLSSFLSVSGRRKRQEVNKSLWLKIEFYVKGEVILDTRRDEQHHLFFSLFHFSFLLPHVILPPLVVIL